MAKALSLEQKFSRINKVKFCFAKNDDYLLPFANNIGAYCMHTPGYGFGLAYPLSDENILRGVFLNVMQADGMFLFNINAVNLKRAARGFEDFEEAEGNNLITEWELSQILTNRDYLKCCTFHNGKVQFKKRLLWKSII